jgi:hypothetical protein
MAECSNKDFRTAIIILVTSRLSFTVVHWLLRDPPMFPTDSWKPTVHLDNVNGNHIFVFMPFDGCSNLYNYPTAFSLIILLERGISPFFVTTTKNLTLGNFTKKRGLFGLQSCLRLRGCIGRWPSVIESWDGTKQHRATDRKLVCDVFWCLSFL